MKSWRICEWKDQAVAVGAGHGLTNSGFVKTNETSSSLVRLAAEGVKASDSGLLEARLWDWISTHAEPTMANLQSEFERHEAGPGVGLMKRLGVQMSNGTFTTEKPEQVASNIEQRTAFIQSLPQPEHSLDSDMLEHFKSRRGLIESVVSTTRTWTLTAAGKSVASEALVENNSLPKLQLNSCNRTIGKKPNTGRSM
jgi:hypothetical protein